MVRGAVEEKVPWTRTTRSPTARRRIGWPDQPLGGGRSAVLDDERGGADPHAQSGVSSPRSFRNSGTDNGHSGTSSAA